MRTHVGEESPLDARAVQSLRLPVQAPSGATGAHPILAADVKGTIDAAVEAIDDYSYGTLSEDWVREDPLGLVASTDPPAQSTQPRFRAKDLIAELDSINAQIHRMMFQVERAVSRLATSGAIS